MKEVIKKWFPLVLAALGAIFVISLYFIGSGTTEHGVFTDIGNKLGLNGAQSGITSSVVNNAAESSSELPVVKYIGGARTVGEALVYQELFQVLDESDEIRLGTDENITMLIEDITDMSGISVCEKLSSADIEAIEDIPSAFILDTEKDILYFHKSGEFRVYVRFYFENNVDALYEFSIPVEVG